MSSPFVPKWKHDVFVSFKGGDGTETFRSPLFKRLKQVGIGHFVDDNREDAGKDIESKRLKALEEARFSLVVFSTNYVDCSQCLNWLVKILNCQRHPGFLVVPIFYENRAKVLESARKRVEKEKKDAKKKEWRGALEEVKKSSGYFELKADRECLHNRQN
ncbi:hypothetical protein BT93_G0520 [Corymbia citriodora subsp. variegata]|nr:hypothetical protein BT93_G0520 [Corymbia citriodora subsp. variegata]